MKPRQDGVPATPIGLALGGVGSPRGRGASSDRPPGEPSARASQLPRALRPAKGQPLPVKCVLLGDAGCGKSSLALAYYGQSLPDGHESDAAPFNVVAKAAGVQVGGPFKGLATRSRGPRGKSEER